MQILCLEMNSPKYLINKIFHAFYKRLDIEIIPATIKFPSVTILSDPHNKRIFKVFGFQLISKMLEASKNGTSEERKII